MPHGIYRIFPQKTVVPTYDCAQLQYTIQHWTVLIICLLSSRQSNVIYWRGTAKSTLTNAVKRNRHTSASLSLLSSQLLAFSRPVICVACWDNNSLSLSCSAHFICRTAYHTHTAASELPEYMKNQQPKNNSLIHGSPNYSPQNNYAGLNAPSE